MTDHVAERTIVITGAAGGFGRLVSQKAAARGARIVGGDVDEAGLAETERLVTEAGGQMATARTDVTDLDEMKALVGLAVERFGAVDVMVNNAGTMPLAFFSDHEAAMDAWNRCIDINVKGVLNGMVAAYGPMMAAGRGQVVNLSSIYGNFPTMGGGVYGATKAAVDFLSESLRQETRGTIKVTVVKPTGVPATGLSAGVVNPAAPIGIWGHYAATDLPRFEAMAAGQLPAAETDPDSVEYFVLDPGYIAEAILHAIDQPWGVSISSVTVRATGDGYVL